MSTTLGEHPKLLGFLTIYCLLGLAACIGGAVVVLAHAIGAIL